MNTVNGEIIYDKNEEEKEALEQFQRRVSAPLKFEKITRAEYDAYIKEKNERLAKRSKTKLWRE